MLQPRSTLTRKPMCLSFQMIVLAFFPPSCFLCGWGLFFIVSVMRKLSFYPATSHSRDCYQVWYFLFLNALTIKMNTANFHGAARVETDGSMHCSLDLMQNKGKCWEMCLFWTVVTLIARHFSTSEPGAILCSSSMPLTFTEGFLH